MLSPIMTATLQAAALSAVSNSCAQLIDAHQNKRIFDFDPLQLLRFVALAFITAPPNYLWQQFLERSLPAYPQVQHPDGGRDIELKELEEADGLGDEAPRIQAIAKPRFSLRNTLAKWFIDCITAGAIMNTLAFLIVMGILKGQPGSQIASNIRTETIPIIVAGYKMWPVASIISFTLIPVHRRILFLSFFGLLWGIYMSLVAARV